MALQGQMASALSSHLDAEWLSVHVPSMAVMTAVVECSTFLRANVPTTQLPRFVTVFFHVRFFKLLVL